MAKLPILQQAALTGLETALNKYLSLDAGSAARLAPLEGRTLEVALMHVGIKWYVRISNGRMMLSGDPGSNLVDATLRGTPLALLRAAGMSGATTALFGEDLEITGDTEVGQQFREALDAIDIDWEEQLSQLVGDVFAHQIGNVFRGLRRWTNESREALREDLADYLKEESRMLPQRQEIEQFLDDVDSLRAATDRLEQRVQRLEQRGGTNDKRGKEAT